MFRDLLKNKILESFGVFIQTHGGQLSVESVRFDVGVSAESWWGDYYTNIAFILSKLVKENPMKIGEELKEIISETDQRGERLFFKIDVIEPGYINFWIEPHYFEEMTALLLKNKSPFKNKKETIVIDYSAPNVAKPMGVGHLRSTILGQALANLHRFLGYKVIGDNHVGDWGTQFGALLYAYKQSPESSKFNVRSSKQNIVEFLFELYKDFFKKAEQDLALWDGAKEETKKLQGGDKENQKLWEWFVEESMKEFSKVYKALGVKFDVTLGESFYQPMLQGIVEEAIKKGVARKDGEAIKIFFDGNLQPIVIQKADGSYLYTTTDLAAIKYRVKKWSPVKILYVVSNEQTLHFEQLFESASLAGLIEKHKLAHIKFGLVLGEKGTKMSTRKGEIIPLKELIEKAVSLAREIVEKENAELLIEEKDAVAHVVGIGAVKWNDLAQHRQKDIVFDWEKMLSIKGFSAPYVQYTYARLMSILRKAKPATNTRMNTKDTNILIQPEEQLILRHFLHYFEVIEDAANLYEPHRLAEYLYKLADLTNNFYEKLPVLKAEKELRDGRLLLISVVANTLKQGMSIFGIDVPERM